MRLKILFFLFCSLSSNATFGQDTILVGQIGSRELLWKTGKVYALNTPLATVRDVVGIGKWNSMDSLTTTAAPHYTWLRTIIRNDLVNASFLDFHFPSVDSISVFAQNPDTTFVIHTGPYTSVHAWPFPENPGLAPIRCRPGESLTLYFRLWSAAGRPFSIRNAEVRSRQYSLNESVNEFREFIGRIEFNGFFLGAAIFAMLFSLFIFVTIGERAFLFYGLYLMGAAAYSVIVKTLPYSYLARLAYLNYPATYMLGEPVQYLFFAAYMAFGKALLDINENHGRLNKTLRFFIALLAASGILLFTYNILSFDYLLQRKAFIVSRLIILPLALTLLLWIIVRVRNPAKWFFIAGSSFFFTGGLLAVMVDPKSRHLFFGGMDASPVVFFKSGILLESLCFALALGYKIRLAQKEKDRATKAYIQQLELNKTMAATETERLEKMVLERTAEVVEKNLEIEAQKRLQAQSDFQRQLSEMEMTALRSQMNPHFIFNSLNSIRYQILKKDYDSAATYLTRFSKLLRYTLQNSREHVVSLAEEIEVNRLYVQLESLRFSQGLEFHLEMDQNADISEIMIPPMLLQPFVENAVKHGLVPSQKELKKLAIRLEASPLGYLILIEDNGIGRHCRPASDFVRDHQRLGMKIAAERISLFNSNYAATIEMEIEDLFDGENPAGTRIIFNYKKRP